eukprot:9788077-Lingulodinium_polyedra.AAC.1
MPVGFAMSLLAGRPRGSVVLTAFARAAFKPVGRPRCSVLLVAIVFAMPKPAGRPPPLPKVTISNSL